MSASARSIAVTDISRGGLAAALAPFLPGARGGLEGPELPALLSGTYGRFLKAYESESVLFFILAFDIAFFAHEPDIRATMMAATINPLIFI